MMRYLLLCVLGIAAMGMIATTGLEIAAADLNYTGTHYDVSGTFFAKYDFPQASIVEWRSDRAANTFSARNTPTGRYYGRDGWALFGTSFSFDNAHSFPGNHDYLNINDANFPNLEEQPYFVTNTQILAHHKAGGDAAALIDDPRTQWGGRWWTFDGVNYPPPNGSNGTGVVPYLKTGFLHGWDEFGHNPATGPAGRYGFVVGENAPKRFRVGVMTDGLANQSLAPEEVYLFQMDPSDPFLNTTLGAVSTGAIPYDDAGGEITPGTNRFVDMHFFDIVNAQPGDLFVIAARAYAGQVHAGVNGISFDVLKDPGDYNADGVVDAADYTVWRDTLGQDKKAGQDADGNNSSDVDAGDHLVWRNNFGHVTPGSGSRSQSLSVPEPAAALCVLPLLVSGILLRLRRRS